MAGFFIVVAMIFSNVTGNIFSGADLPAWGKFLGAAVFSIASSFDFLLLAGNCLQETILLWLLAHMTKR